MAKKDNSGLKAGFTKEDTNQRKAEPGREAQDQASLEVARKQPEEIRQQEPAEAAEQPDDGGPTVTMQGVSGKKITGTVKVVKVNKKQADTAAPETNASEASDISPSSAETVPVREKETTAPERPEPAEKTPAEAAPSPVQPSAPVEVTPDPVREMPETAERTEPVRESRPAAAAGQAEKKQAARDKREVKPEPVRNAGAGPGAIKPTLPSTTPSPRKIKSGSEAKAEAAAAPAPAAGQPRDARRGRDQGRPAEPQQRGARPQAAQDSRPGARRDGQQPAAADTAPRQSRPQGSPPREQRDQRTPAASAGPGPNAPNRGQGPTREAKPVGTLNRPITPGKVGNIFDKSTKSDKVDSSLAATAKAFAQRKERQAQAATRTDDRTRRPQTGAPRGPRTGGPGQPFRPSSDGFGDKDKDDDSKPQFRSRKTTRKPAADAAFAPPAAASRGGFAKRDARDKSKKDRERGGRDGLRPESDVGNYRSRGRRRQSGSQDSTRQQVAVLTHVSLPETLTVKELAEALKKTSAEVIKKLLGMGVLATLNQTVDYDTAALIAGEFNIETDLLVEETEEDILFDETEDDPADLQPRPPVVVVMGHVDHGKTSLLDYIRSEHVTTGEAGGITQHIGAYMVRLGDRKITFLDTPGHEAFTTMRARGAQATDIAILVVAADDGVMPQTVEAINHARAAGTDIVVAINKIDKPGVNIDKVKQELAQHNLIPEEWGGSTVMVPVSAKTGEGMDTLLEMVLLTADILDLKANPDRQAKGIVIEAKLDKNRGPLATMLVQRGTLRVGDTIVTGSIVGNIRAMSDANHNAVKKASPSVPVEIMGLPEVPEAGDIFYVVEDDRVARQLAEKRRDKQREDQMSPSSRMSLDNLFAQMSTGEVQELNLIVKADVQGSVEAVRQSMEKLNTDKVKVNIIHGAVGAINESDVRLAEVSNAIIIGFNVRPPANVTETAKASGVDVRLYSVIYTAIEDIEAAMKGMLAPEYKEVVLGHCEVRETFKVSSVGTIGGGYVTDGKIVRNSSIRLVRDGIVIHDGKLASLRRFKDDVREVAAGYECGISIERYNDLKVGDVIEAYEMQEVERK